VLSFALLVPLLSLTSHAAVNSDLRLNDLRLVEAVKIGDKDAARSLLKQHVDVNVPEADGATALAWAVHRDDLDTTQLLIRAGANVNKANDFGVTPLALAATNGNAAMVEYLLKSGANPNAALPTGETALMTAARTGSTGAVKALLAYGADAKAKENQQGQTALMWAVAQKHLDVTRALIEHRADVHARTKGGFTALLFAARQGDLDSVRSLLDAGADVNEATPDGMSALLVASANGYESLAIFLLERGADPNAANKEGITALHYAAQKGMSAIGGVQPDIAVTAYLYRPDMVELAKALLAHGANANARIRSSRRLPHGNTPRFSMDGATPFLLASAASDPGLMRLLAAGGADPLLATNEHTTPLMVAAGLGRYQDFPKDQEKNALEATKLALELGADINGVGENGYTALHGAAYVGAEPIIEFLVERGAKIDVTDNFQQTPLSVAEGLLAPGIVDFSKKPFGPHENAAKLLLKLGATPDNSAALQSVLK
jgi:ankyrin repeat protein